MTPGAGPVLLDLPFTGPCLVRNSPARRVPSHGTDLLGTRYAIDLVPVDERDRTSGSRDWRTLLATEPAERFVGWGLPVLSPTAGVVVAVHDGEPDGPARRSPLAQVPFALGQAGRLRRGVAAVAGNHVVVALPGGAFVAVCHLRSGSVAVAVGERVASGQVLGECGSSGNATEPHVHLQVMDAADPARARGLTLAFRAFRERPRGVSEAVVRSVGVPGEGTVVEPLPR